MRKLVTTTSGLLGLCLLGSFVPAEAGVIYLTCNLDQKRTFGVLTGPNWSDWGPLRDGNRRVLTFTLSEDSQSGSVLDEGTSESTKLPFVTFQPETILAQKGGVGVSNDFGNAADTYTISRTDGSAIWESVVIPGQMKIQLAGQCAKSERKQTLF